MINTKDDRELLMNTRDILRAATAQLQVLANGKLKWDIQEKNPTGDNVEGVRARLLLDEQSPYHTQIAQFNITYLPACAPIAVFHDVSVAHGYRGKGIGKLLHQLRLNIAKAAHCTLVMCTVDRDNYVEQAILETNGWSRVKSFDRQYTWPPFNRNKDALNLWIKSLE